MKVKGSVFRWGLPSLPTHLYLEAVDHLVRSGLCLGEAWQMAPGIG